MKIAFLISHLRRCGPVNVLYALVSGLLDAELCAPDELCVVTLSPEKDGSRFAEFKELGVHLRSAFVRPRHLVGSALALRRALTEFAPDVCHSHGVKADGLLAVASVGLPVVRVSTVHNVPAEDFSYTFGAVRGKLAAALAYASLMALRGEVVGCSKTVARHLARSIGGRRGAIWNPVESPPGSNPSILRSATRVVSAGNVSELKNTRAVVERFLGSRHCAALTLSVFGEGPLRRELMERHRDPRITWPGFSQALGAEFRAAAAYVSASSSEGMPLTPLEALLCGCPCVLSDIAAHRELAEVAPGRVFLFDPTSQRSFDAALEGAISAAATDESEAAALARRFAPVRIAADYMRVYERATGGASRRGKEAA